jgi:hypothetical protein
MKRLSSLVLIALVAVALAAPLQADPPAFPTPEPTWSDADWQAFSENLVVGLAGDNDGVRASALQMIIHYGEKLDVDGAAFDVARIYRDHADERMRRLAAVSCLNLGSDWAVSYLRMSEPFEKSERLKHTIRAVLAEVEAREAPEKGTVEAGELKMIAERNRR